MVKPLSFKGDKKPKKRKHAKLEDNDADLDAADSKAVQTIESTEDDSWVSADAPSDLTGPTIFVLPTSPPTALSCDVNGAVFAIPIENMVEGEPSSAEPHDVRQVWIATKITGADTVTFKGHHGRYLGCDRFGILSAKREAVGMEETFKLLPVPDTLGFFALQTLAVDGEDRFIAVNEDDSKKGKAGQAVRGDATEFSFNTGIRVRMQARFKPRLKANKETKAREKISRQELEAAVGRRLEEDEVRRLKKARREGNYHEEILDVRVKGKHDKFAS
ncbi:MAG: hypothetical protein Q9227_000479 [Pyrenula ochraceoflavens]